MKDLPALENILGVKFKNSSLLKEAITHRSYLNENPKENISHNERLEFLGDAVLELIVTEYLFKKYSKKAEGELTAVRAALVNTNMLFEVAKTLKLRGFTRLSRGEAKDMGKGRHFIMADMVEAIIGAIYLDQGYEESKEFILKNICCKADKILKEKLWRDAKSLFQEKAQDVVNITPTYDVISETGPDHQKYFVVGVYLGDELIAKGEGYSKQEAQQDAAEKALKKKNWND